MVSTPSPEAATSNEAKTATPSRKRRFGNSEAGPERPSKRQATVQCRMTRSRFKRMNEGNSAPQSLNPGLEMNPRRRRELAGGQRATTAAPRSPYAVVQASMAPERLESKSGSHSQIYKKDSEADVAAASRLAQAAIEAGFTTGSPAGNDVVSEPSQSHGMLKDQDPAKSMAEDVNFAKATQDCIPPEQPSTSSPSTSTFLPQTHKIDENPDNCHGDTECNQSCPVVVVGNTLEKARDKTVATESEAAPKLPGAREVTGTDADAQVNRQGKAKGQPPIPWLPDKADSFQPQWKWSEAWPVQSQTRARVSVEVSPKTQSTPPLVRSGGIGDDVETPVSSHVPCGSNLTLPWQPDANRAAYTAGAAQIVSPEEHQALTGPLPPAVLQWEPTPYSVEGCQYSPEVFAADFEEYEPEDFELEEWDDDVDP